ncbi:sensor histidine kinase [Actinoplanes friuliensis]|uniref:histidine kinase n=1 Tax=Actinoplanes friuliensis DSM 7358 TaxID=1246995 RepID=U5VX48_9ACTN|nr:ATP-binding protein [Actinoplanes friuliensis]AGZ41367.1 sensory histidine kinase [Actinoplanes friuliensis DSM 7358]
MADGRAGRASVRLRTTAAAVLVVAAALLAGAFTLVLLVRGSLRDGVEATAEQRASDLAAQVETTGLPPQEQADDSDDEDVSWQITDAAGTVVRSSPPLDGDQASVEATEDAADYTITVRASLEEVGDTTSALIPPLLIGLPLLLVLVGGTTWVVVTRALAPVERIRREVEDITGDRLERRVPEPHTRDEIHRLARTMNQMLGRLESSRVRQQRFVADASHELRSPLAGIRQVAEVATAHPGALPEGELAAAVLEESARMQRLVDQLLLLTRADDGAVTRVRQDVDLDDLALAEARRVRRSGLVIDTSGISGARVRGDQLALAQVVRNLVDNAARHATSKVTVSTRSTGGHAELVVEDDGAGIPADQRERVFERFVRLDEARARDAGGSGLGLAIVKEIVAAHDGSVTVSGGARFVVRLPA